MVGVLSVAAVTLLFQVDLFQDAVFCCCCCGMSFWLLVAQLDVGCLLDADVVLSGASFVQSDRLNQAVFET